MDSQILSALITALVAIVVFFIRQQYEKKKHDLEIRKLEAELQNSQHNNTRMDDIRKGMNIIAAKLLKKNFRPDIIITFNRSGTALAGMFAVNMKIDEIISITRHTGSVISNTSGNSREAPAVGEYLKLNPSKLRDKRILVLMMLNDTGATVEDGIKYLHNHKITQEVEIASMYVTHGTMKRWPDMIYAFETTDPSGVLKNLPWIEEYDFFPRRK